MNRVFKSGLEYLKGAPRGLSEAAAVKNPIASKYHNINGDQQRLSSYYIVPPEGMVAKEVHEYEVIPVVEKNSGISWQIFPSQNR